MTDVDGPPLPRLPRRLLGAQLRPPAPPAARRARTTQLDRLTLTVARFYNDQLGPFARDLAALTGKEMVLPMNSGAEAVETAIKVARKWGYLVKGVPRAAAIIVAMEGNFHGRTTTIGQLLRPTPVATRHYGAVHPGLPVVPYGDIAACGPRSTRTPSRCCSSRSRARAA